MELAEQRLLSRAEAERLKKEIASRMRMPKIPSDMELASLSGAKVLKKPVKTASGVSVITVVAPLFSCPHGRCVYCPGGRPYGTPQSYTGEEVVVRNATALGFDPYRQVKAAVQRLQQMGHFVDKVELIVIGGTFTASSPEFQRRFIQRCLDALNGVDSSSLDEALKLAEDASIHVSGITVETKPDWAKKEIASRAVEMGVTRVEIGVQALDDEILSMVNRGHSLEDVVEATADLRDLAFKVCYHMMPNLPGSSPSKDLQMLVNLFEDSRFRPDHLKIYPTLVLPNTELERMWRNGDYRPYSEEDLVDVLAEFMRRVPPYVRISRVQREIPLKTTLDGLKTANLRQMVEERSGTSCRCIRCREHAHRRLDVMPERAEFRSIVYEASGGLEHFISLEDPVSDALLGYVRLRIPRRWLRPELENAALVRELHVYGFMRPVGSETGDNTSQHRGFGKALMMEAEETAFNDEGLDKVAVISGVGVRNYYRKLGYVLQGPYMCKHRRCAG
ncbi:MAG: tRNA uridine(34) 5-carboxymethylaminomethyl modification radical SAM/GNAT enzyme Elp3 [Candidatus Caldarchaeum sp.]|nr:tRNA uridine(34) 5-carboxymethylaminomethyl modification radical SAM/GNAT enzyme Elp3 [Candidatus Caldarchaeum sp.]MDW8359431.1 tRNA uridine(34) 5-carboxymethylaminomethyl modification radical SAM/GNAT enzyme Elp3 [Candidatus Caldarchaeum sp.]